MKITTNQDTVFKLAPRQARDLPENEKLSIAAGQSFAVLAWRDADDHYLLTFSTNLGTQRRNTWYAFKAHIDGIAQPGRIGAKQVSGAGLKLIKEFEGFRAKAYLCPAGVWTIGYGFTKGVRRGQWISEPEAAQRLREELAGYEAGVLRLLKTEVSQGQFDALVSLAYNIGLGAIARSSVIKFHNRRDFAAAADAFLLWNKGGGRVLSGLERRRRAERALYLS